MPEMLTNGGANSPHGPMDLHFQPGIHPLLAQIYSQLWSTGHLTALRPLFWPWPSIHGPRQAIQEEGHRTRHRFVSLFLLRADAPCFAHNCTLLFTYKQGTHAH